MIEFISSMVPENLAAHAPALLIAIPMLMAPIAAFMPSGRLAWILSILATGFALIMAIVLLSQVRSIEGGAVISYAMGGWRPDAGIEFRIDALNAMVLLLVSAIGFLAAIFSWPTVLAEIREAKTAMFYAAYLVCFTGLTGVASTGDAFNLFVFLEISSIATYVLVALGASRDRRALPAAGNYLLLGTIGASFFVVGVGFLYAATGTLNMAELAVRLESVQDNKAVFAGYAFIVVGLGIKAAMFPLPFTVAAASLPGIYQQNPSLLVRFAVRVRDLNAPATEVEYLVQSATFDAAAGEFAIVVDGAGLADQLLGLSTPEVEIVPFFFRLSAAGVEDSFPPNTEIKILFDAARANPATGDPSTDPAEIFSGGDISAFTPDITDLNSDVWDFVRVKFEFLIDIDDRDAARPGIDYLQILYGF